MYNETEPYIDHAIHDAISAHTKDYLDSGKTIDTFDSAGTYRGTILAYDAEPVYDVAKAAYFLAKANNEACLADEEDLLELISYDEALLIVEEDYNEN